jgi:adenylate cyclase
VPVEIERKFLVVGEGWRAGGEPGQRFCQGYLADAGGVTVRVRRAGSRAYLTVKGRGVGLVRPEFEYGIPVDEAEAMLADLCRRPLIEKTRHEVRHARHVWHVDVFGGDSAGLVLAEVELRRPDEPVALPQWVGEEVTFDLRFRNSSLAASPVGTAQVARP